MGVLHSSALSVTYPVFYSRTAAEKESESCKLLNSYLYTLNSKLFPLPMLQSSGILPDEVYPLKGQGDAFLPFQQGYLLLQSRVLFLFLHSALLLDTGKGQGILCFQQAFLNKLFVHQEQVLVHRGLSPEISRHHESSERIIYHCNLYLYAQTDSLQKEENSQVFFCLSIC